MIGVIVLADTPRESARDVIDLLRAAGVAHTAVLDRRSRGRGESARPSRSGVEDVRAGLLPAEKVAAVRSLRERWGQVGMVGDGVNDAPALAASDVGIAMGAVGSDAALETADVALMGDELARLPFAIRLSRAAVRTVRVNIALALGVKAAFLAMAIAGESSLWMAIVADTGMSLRRDCERTAAAPDSIGLPRECAECDGARCRATAAECVMGALRHDCLAELRRAVRARTTHSRSRVICTPCASAGSVLRRLSRDRLT